MDELVAVHKLTSPYHPTLPYDPFYLPLNGQHEVYRPVCAHTISDVGNSRLCVAKTSALGNSGSHVEYW